MDGTCAIHGKKCKMYIKPEAVNIIGSEWE
jgi:hypothetical protein